MLVPLVFAASIALAPPVPVFISVSLMPVFELVRSYPIAGAVKSKLLMVRDALKLGCLPSAELKRAVSVGPGTLPPHQLPALLKSVPLLFQVRFAASADCSGRRAVAAPTAQGRRSHPGNDVDRIGRIHRADRRRARRPRPAFVVSFAGLQDLRCAAACHPARPPASWKQEPTIRVRSPTAGVGSSLHTSAPILECGEQI